MRPPDQKEACSSIGCPAIQGPAGGPCHPKPPPLQRRPISVTAGLEGGGYRQHGAGQSWEDGRAPLPEEVPCELPWLPEARCSNAFAFARPGWGGGQLTHAHPPRWPACMQGQAVRPGPGAQGGRTAGEGFAARALVQWVACLTPERVERPPCSPPWCSGHLAQPRPARRPSSRATPWRTCPSPWTALLRSFWAAPTGATTGRRRGVMRAPIRWWAR